MQSVTSPTAAALGHDHPARGVDQQARRVVVDHAGVDLRRGRFAHVLGRGACADGVGDLDVVRLDRLGQVDRADGDDDRVAGVGRVEDHAVAARSRAGRLGVDDEARVGAGQADRGVGDRDRHRHRAGRDLVERHGVAVHHAGRRRAGQYDGLGVRRDAVSGQLSGDDRYAVGVALGDRDVRDRCVVEERVAADHRVADRVDALAAEPRVVDRADGHRLGDVPVARVEHEHQRAALDGRQHAVDVVLVVEVGVGRVRARGRAGAAGDQHRVAEAVAVEVAEHRAGALLRRDGDVDLLPGRRGLGQADAVAGHRADRAAGERLRDERAVDALFDDDGALRGLGDAEAYPLRDDVGVGAVGRGDDAG